MSARGAWRRTTEREGRFVDLLAGVGAGPLVAIADARVLALHPHAARALAGRGAQVVPLRAGEGAKALATLERLGRLTAAVPRGATVLALGGGTIGDVATVYAHLFKRGVGRFLQVPTTLLAAVDSSVGGKGAVNVAGVKNLLGAFHFADEGWVCPEFFTTLTEAQRREGRLEAWKMAVSLDARVYARWRAAAPDDVDLVRASRRLKAAVVQGDPFETRGRRVVLNFGHTFGHVIESLTGYRVRHGEAVGLGMLVALDVGVALGVTPAAVAQEVEAALPTGPGARARLRRILGRARAAQVARVLAADKKGTGAAGLAMVLLERPGRWRLVEVPRAVWTAVALRRAPAAARGR